MEKINLEMKTQIRSLQLEIQSEKEMNKEIFETSAINEKNLKETTNNLQFQLEKYKNMIAECEKKEQVNETLVNEMTRTTKELTSLNEKFKKENHELNEELKRLTNNQHQIHKQLLESQTMLQNSITKHEEETKHLNEQLLVYQNECNELNLDMQSLFKDYEYYKLKSVEYANENQHLARQIMRLKGEIERKAVTGLSLKVNPIVSHAQFCPPEISVPSETSIRTQSQSPTKQSNVEILPLHNERERVGNNERHTPLHSGSMPPPKLQEKDEPNIQDKMFIIARGKPLDSVKALLQDTSLVTEKSYNSEQKKVQEMENKISILLQEKSELERQLFKLPSHPRTGKDSRKKVYLETQLHEIDSQLHQYKQLVRSHYA
ncbi:viral A-type inclusion protein [Reticulomyxa filosa]|uniref:Viral A-type inclusion protein n=1 Tax=Reticulomyxa filosa TaxID=46433 RepID=X6MMD7_RETFI|nr:viral A-type inclusion protein [Reticulomyxa filosa]|eukprot:ETO15178.1 viral A-type inclusion protein [Reticulomyxa filosa]